MQPNKLITAININIFAARMSPLRHLHASTACICKHMNHLQTKYI